MPNMYKIVTVKANANELHNTERPAKGSGHGKMIDPRRNSMYERPFTQEGNYLVVALVAKQVPCDFVVLGCCDINMANKLMAAMCHILWMLNILLNSLQILVKMISAQYCLLVAFIS